MTFIEQLLNILQNGFIHPFDDLKYISWVTLRKSHTWEDVHKLLEFMIEKKIILNESVDETGLFDEYCI
jgi:hypothetical protein